MIWVVTSPERIHEEAAYLNALTAAGPTTLLVRKPGWALLEYTALLEQLHDYSRVMAADYPELLECFPLAGFHASERMREKGKVLPAHLAATAHIASGGRAPLVLSTSIHFPQSPGPEWRYLLLGPVFDSISKPGYTGKAALFNTVPPNTLAIGGVHAGNIAQVKRMGFCGAALLGALWQHPAAAIKNYQTIQQLWERTP